jgi:hypothetical protein
MSAASRPRRHAFSYLNAWLFRFGARRVLHGFELAALGVTEAFGRLCLDRAAAALDLIAECDPVRLRRLARDAPRVVVGWVSGADGCFDPATGLVVLDVDTVTRDGMTSPQLARLLVHEATHARIERAGIHYEVARRARIERVCQRAELALAERMLEPDREWHAQAIRDELAAPPEDYSDEAFVERHAAAAKAAGLPPWLVEWGRRRMLRRLVGARGGSR